MKNKQFEDNAEYISKQLLHHIYYLKRKERHELRQRGSLHQHSSGPSRMFNQKKKIDLGLILSDLHQMICQKEKTLVP